MKKRGTWNSRTAFVLAAIGSAAGLGNAWRFPYRCASNGGGAFLVPYFVALITAGIPLLIAEFAIGHKFQAGASVAFGKIKKGWSSLGWWAVGAGFVIITYYSIIMAWVVDYLWYSLTNAWGDAPADFFLNKVLQISGGPAELGGFSVPVLIGLVISWLAIYWCIRDGVNSVSKVVKWTVSLPIVMLVILAIRAITLPGAIDGISYYLNPDFSVLTDWNVWAAAYGQVFFTLSLAFSVMVAYASYLPKKSDITNNAFITAFANCGISFLAGFAVFGTLGHMALEKGAEVAEVAGNGGIGLAFWVYPEAINYLPFGIVIFSLVFFIMLFTLGIDSAFSIIEGVVAALDDHSKWTKKRIIRITCLVGAAISLLFATKGGLHWLDIVDKYVNDFALIGVGFFEAICFGWVFKAKKIREHANPISDIQLGSWYDIMVKFVSPFVLGVTFIMTIVNEIKNVMNNTMYGNYPMWACALGGWLVTIGVIIIAIILSRKTISRLKETEKVTLD